MMSTREVKHTCTELANDIEIHASITQVALAYSNRTGCTLDEAWDDVWEIVDNMLEAGLQIKQGAKP